MGKLELYIDYFKDKLFSKKEKEKKNEIDLEEERFEKWLFQKDNERFKSEDTDDYTTNVDGETGSISITAKRKSIYAWTTNPLFRYKDFVLDFTVSFAPEGIAFETQKAGTCACGFLFRYINEGVFYALLISDQGWLRLDVMVNGTPLPILGWTKPVNCHLSREHNSLQIKLIAVDTNFHILVDDEWLASVENDVLQSAGKIAVAIQNWECFSQNTCTITNMQLVSEISPVENADEVATQKADSNANAHINLAKTFYAMGKYDSAASEINKAETISELSPEDSVLAGRIYFAQGRKDEAEKAFIAAIDADKQNIKLIEELAGLYYYSNDFKSLGKILEKTKKKNAQFENSALLHNFFGHYYNWKQEHTEAAEHYKKAFSLNDTEGAFALNAALEYEILLDKDNAVDYLLKAGYAFLQVQNYTNLAECVNKLEILAKDDIRTCSLLGKFYYGVENYHQALIYFEKLCESGSTKSASDWYLYALLIKDADYKKYLKILEKVVKLDKTSSLYFYRLAEAQFYSGLDCSKTLEKAIALDPDNAWNYNLKALVLMQENKLDDALEQITTARNILPDEIALLTNYVEIKRLQGKLDEVLPLFDLSSSEVDVAMERNRGDAFHLIANALYKEGDIEHAAEWYAKAEKLLPNNYDLLVNYGQNSIELGLLNEADTLLVKALDIKNTIEVYRLIARLSTLKGNYIRAKAVIDEAFSFYPDNADLLFDLIHINMQCNKKQEALEAFNKLQAIETSPRVQAIKKKLKQLP